MLKIWAQNAGDAPESGIERAAGITTARDGADHPQSPMDRRRSDA